MKSKKLVNELNSLMDSAESKRQKHKKILKTFFRDFKKEEQKIRKKMKQENNKASLKKLKRKLGMVKEAYALLDYA